MKTQSQGGQGVYKRIVIAVLVVLFLLSQAWFARANLRAGSTIGQVAGSILLLSVPLGILYGSIGVLLIADWQKRHMGTINGSLRRILYLMPRMAAILIIVFVGLFALDVFVEGVPFWQMIGGFLIHLLPSIVMSVILALAWKREWIGFIAFLAVALFFLRFLFPNPRADLGLLLIFSGPMAVIAVLFLVNWRWKTEIRG